jgi:branched-chain amino acid aminotransferase
MSARLTALDRGFHDALLVGRAGEVLEGPTYSIGWVHGGSPVTPSLDLGILASITRQVTIEAAAAAGLAVREVAATLDEMLAADEIFVMSTIREVAPVVAVGDQRFEPGPVTATLAAAFRAIVSAETGPS